jgi:hypothetical protein
LAKAAELSEGIGYMAVNIHSDLYGKEEVGDGRNDGRREPEADKDMMKIFRMETVIGFLLI